MSSNVIVGVAAFMALADAVAASQTLATVDAAELEVVTDESAVAIGAAVASSPSMRKLFLDCSGVTDDGALALARAVAANTGMKVVAIVGGAFPYDVAETYAAMVRTDHRVHHMSFVHVRITPTGVDVLVRALERCRFAFDFMFVQPVPAVAAVHDDEDEEGADEGMELRNAAIESAIERGHDRCRVLVLMEAAGVARFRTAQTPLAGLLRRDGDNAIVTRVAGFLLLRDGATEGGGGFGPHAEADAEADAEGEDAVVV